MLQILPRLAILLLALLGSYGVLAQNSRIVADVSSYYVDISHRFTGTKVLIYGAIDSDEGDVIIIAKGANQDFILDKKERQLGLWLKGSSIHYHDTPRFYHIVSAREVSSFASPSARETYQLDLNSLDIQGRVSNATLEEAIRINQEMRPFFIEQMVKQGLYLQSSDRLRWLGKRLFRADLTFPVNVAAGTYIIETYYLRDGYVVSAQALPLFIRKSGFLGFLFAFAHNYSFLYGIVAIFLAIISGALAYWMLRRND